MNAWPINVVLLIDELSKLYNTQPDIQDKFLWAFHNIKNNNKMYVICSVIAVGTFGILKLCPSNSAISPFNVGHGVQSLYFTIEEVRNLFHEFVKDHDIMIDDAIVKDIWAKSNGCATLLNWSMGAQIPP